jgi:hypothetical protein
VPALHVRCGLCLGKHACDRVTRVSSGRRTYVVHLWLWVHLSVWFCNRLRCDESDCVKRPLRPGGGVRCEWHHTGMGHVLDHQYGLWACVRKEGDVGQWQ